MAVTNPADRERHNLLLREFLKSMIPSEAYGATPFQDHAHLGYVRDHLSPYAFSSDYIRDKMGVPKQRLELESLQARRNTLTIGGRTYERPV